MKRYKLKILGLSETRWTGSEKTQLLSGKTSIHSGQNEGQPYTHGVKLLMTPEATRALLSWKPMSLRILTARFNSKGRKVTIIQPYVPTNVAAIEKKDEFYQKIQAALDKTPKKDMKILMGDTKAKVGADNTNSEHIMGRHGIGLQIENGELFVEFCIFNDLVIGGTLFPHKTIHKTTLTFLDGRTENYIDHITISRKWRRSLHDARVKRGADAASNHHLVVALLKIKLKAYKDQVDRPSHKYNVNSLKVKSEAEKFKIELRNRFSVLSQLPEEPVEEHWHSL